MNRKLLDYLPPVLCDVLEFQAINEANEPEISLAWDALALVMANQFLDSATAAGVAVWEKELKLYPKDTDTLDTRKARIKAMWNLELPYTIPWLKKWLQSLCGSGSYDVSTDDYTLNIQLDYTVLQNADAIAAEILDMLLTIRPENMLILMTALLQSTGSVQLGICTQRTLHMEIYPLLVHELETNGSFVMAGPLEYHATVEIYPKEG